MAVKEIKPQYTVDSYIDVLKKRIDTYEKWERQQGVLADIIARNKESNLAKIEQTSNLDGIERLHYLALMLDSNTKFCQSEGDVFSTARRTVLDYCCTDVLMAYGVDNLVNRLLAAVPREYWFATDMADSGIKTRQIWCDVVFTGKYKRPTELKSIQDNSAIEGILSNCKYEQGALRFNDLEQFGNICDICNENGVKLYGNIPVNKNIVFSPTEPLALCLYGKNKVYVIRVWCGDDTSGIKGRKALYINVFDAVELSRYRYSIAL